MVLLVWFAGCGSSEPDPQSGKANQATNSQPAIGYQPVVVDHGKDEVEFRLRRSLAGLEALIEDYKITGADGIEELQQRKAELQRQLQGLEGD